MSDSNKLKNWKELEGGGVIVEAGNSVGYETGTWRTSKPVWDAGSCTHCLLCWVFCPEDAVILRDVNLPNGKTRKSIEGIDYFHCKGCGLCVRECPVTKKGLRRVLSMEKEEK